MSILKNIKYSINKRLAQIHKTRIWAKYGIEMRYHFSDPNFSIGEFTYGVPDIIIYSKNYIFNIGKFSSIANDVKICLGGEHPLDEVSQYPFYQRKKEFPNAKEWSDLDKIHKVEIGNDVWLGRGVTVLSDVKISDGAIIGAGSIVSKDIPPYAIAVGNPIKIIKYRTTQENIEKLLEIKWWNLPIEQINDLIPYMKDINRFISICHKQSKR